MRVLVYAPGTEKDAAMKRVEAFRGEGHRASFRLFRAGVWDRSHVEPADLVATDVEAVQGDYEAAGVDTVDLSAEAPQEDAGAPEWTLSTSPEEYLERYGPDAKNSGLARRVLEASDG